PIRNMVTSRAKPRTTPVLSTDYLQSLCYTIPDHSSFSILIPMPQYLAQGSNIMNDLNGFYGPNAGYVLELYERYLADPSAVDEELRTFFAQWAPTDLSVPSAHPTPSAPPDDTTSIPPVPSPVAPSTPYALSSSAPLDVTRTVGAARLIRYIRELGYL